MPIKDKSKYPADWEYISDRIRFERAGGRCERCGVGHGMTIARHRLRPDEYVIFVDGDYFAYPDGGIVPQHLWGLYGKLIKVVLTVAHLDHNPANNSETNLMAMCQRCHLRYDAKVHVQNARQTRIQKHKNASQLSILFDDLE